MTKPLEARFAHVEHVNRTDLPFPASDAEIWAYAKANDFCIVSNDEDFLNLLFQKGFPPKLVLLRTGNQKTSFIKKVLINHVDEIHAMERSEEQGVLEIWE